MKRKMSLFSIVMLSLSSIIGSGWLFGSGMAARVAGPAAIISWMLGGIIIGVIAYNYIELGTMFPTSGGMSQYASFSHGSLLGFIAGWANWVSLLTIIPIEAVAAVQYMSSWPWAWANWTRGFVHNGNVTTPGLVIVFLFMLAFTLLNFWSISLLTRFTSAIASFKIIVPVGTILILMLSGFHTGNFHQAAGFLPNGSASIFTATTVAGIIFSYNAFQTTINMGNEIEHPEKNILRAIVISFGISMVIYTLLQVAFIGAVPTGMLAKAGWSGINFNSPFADIAILINLGWLADLLYIDAFVSPFGTGVTFVATTSRALAAMTSSHHMPTSLGALSQHYRTPRRAMVVNLFLGIILVMVFRNWGALSSVISTSTLIAYMTGPITVLALRKLAPDYHRTFKIRNPHFWGLMAYLFSSMAIYWAKWPTTIEVFFVIALGLPFYFYFELQRTDNRREFMKALKATWWLVGQLLFLTFMSWAGSHDFGGNGLIAYPWDFVLVLIGSLPFYFWGIASGYQNPQMSLAKELNDRTVDPE